MSPKPWLVLLLPLVAWGAEPPATPTPTITPAPSPGATRRPALGGGIRQRDLGGAGGSLADIVRRQKEERAREGKKKSLGVIDNESLRKGPPGTASRPTPRAGPSPTASPASAAIPEVRDDSGRTESDWRATMTAARNRLSAAEARIQKLDAETHRLENDFYAWSDGNYRERVIKPAWDQARAELERARQEAEDARKAITDLEEDARRSNTPPGWLR